MSDMVALPTPPVGTRRLAYAVAGAGAAGLVGLSTMGAVVAGLNALVQVRPRGVVPDATVTAIGPSRIPGCEMAVTLQGHDASEPGVVGLSMGRGRLLAGPPTRVDDGWLRHASALPGLAAPMLNVGQGVNISCDPWEQCDDPFALGAVTAEVATEVGPLKVTSISPASGTRRAIVYLHGRGGRRHTGWWLAPTALDAGWRAVMPDYRNDEGGPLTGRYLLGGEWIDLVYVLDWLAADGVEEVVLVGWSMGGNIAASYLRQRHRSPERFAHHPTPVGLVLDAAALDWGKVLRHVARARRLPGGFVPAVMTYGQLATRINWRDLNHLDEPAHLDLPLLAYHGVEDDIVPDETSVTLARNLGHVQLERFEGAGHCRSVNHDPARYLTTLRRFLDRI